MKQSKIARTVRINNAKVFKQEQIKIYVTLRATRLAAAYYRKQSNVVRCNVFIKELVNKAGDPILDKRGVVKTIPALYLKTI